MSCFLLPCLQFSFQKGFLGPAWPHIPWSLVSGRKPRSSILHCLQTTRFQQCFFYSLFVELDAQVTPKRSQNQVFWKAFFNNNAEMEKGVWTAPAWTECIWGHPMHRSGGTGNCRTNGLRRKRAWEAQKCTKNANTRLPLRSRWAPRARTFLLISPWAPPGAATGAQRSQNLFLAPKIINIWPPELHKWTQDYPKLRLDLKSEPRKQTKEKTKHITNTNLSRMFSMRFHRKAAVPYQVVLKSL